MDTDIRDENRVHTIRKEKRKLNERILSRAVRTNKALSYTLVFLEMRIGGMRQPLLTSETHFYGKTLDYLDIARGKVTVNERGLSDEENHLVTRIVTSWFLHSDAIGSLNRSGRDGEIRALNQVLSKLLHSEAVSRDQLRRAKSVLASVRDEIYAPHEIPEPVMELHRLTNE